MDQNALLLLVMVALMAEKPVAHETLPGPIKSCGMIQVEAPRIADLRMPNPSTISPGDKTTLESLAAFMREHNCSVRVEGYMEVSGRKARKRADDRKRADSVLHFLTEGLPAEKRVKKDQVKAEGKGEPSEAGLSANEKKFARIVL